MKKYLIVDTNHLYHRVKHGVKGPIDERIGLALHVLISSIYKTWKSQGGDHIIFALDGRSWRKDFYPPYKNNRAITKEQKSAVERGEDEEFIAKFNIFTEFVQTKTNCTILHNNRLEADDLIAGFIRLHPDDHHIIVSSDGDFEQLLSPNVVQFNAITNELITLTGIYNEKGKLVTDRKTGLPKESPDPEWSLFVKAMRGCSTDNVFSAYPGVRENGTKNKVGLREAFEDRHKKGFAFNNLMLQRWADHEGNEHRVLDDYNRNVILVDLGAQPDEIKALIDKTIAEATVPKNTKMVGINFMKFCGQFDLAKLSNDATNISKIFSMAFPK